MRPPVQPWVKSMVNGIIPPPKYEVGSVVVIKGRHARLTDGQYWGEYGLSNFWYWRYLDKKKPRTDCGYGGEWPLAKPKRKTKIKSSK